MNLIGIALSLTVQSCVFILQYHKKCKKGTYRQKTVGSEHGLIYSMWIMNISQNLKINSCMKQHFSSVPHIAIMFLTDHGFHYLRQNCLAHELDESVHLHLQSAVLTYKHHCIQSFWIFGLLFNDQNEIFQLWQHRWRKQLVLSELSQEHINY